MNDTHAPALRGRRLLVVEDDYFIAADIVRTLEAIGVEVVGPAGGVRDALDLIRGAVAPLDAALLDIHLGNERVFPVADELIERAVPYIFVTGYDRVVIPEAYATAPRCEKPLDRSLMVRVLTKIGVGAHR
jgi:CheY-like chemotaxis protein